MRRLLLLLTMVGAVLLATTGVVLAQQTTTPSDQKAATPASSSEQPTKNGVIPGKYIVVLKDDTENAAQVANEHAQRFGLTVSHRYEHALKGYAATIPDAALDKVRADSRVQFVSEDREVQAVRTRSRQPTTQDSSKQGATTEGTVSTQGTVPLTAGDSNPTGVRRIEAGTTTTAHQASNVGVAVIDTGINLSHRDLTGSASDGKNCLSKGRKATPAEDDNGHGTHVAGTIGAQNNRSGVAGVAPGTQLYAVKVLNSQGSGTWSQVICGIDWVTQNAAAKNIKVASMSLGGGGSNDNNCGNSNNDAMHKAICNSTNNAGVTYVVAAGNSAANLATFTPAAYPEALTVTAASDSDGAPGGTGGAPTCRTGETDDAYATFSNYAVNTTEINHTIAGPGVCIYSTWLNGGYNTISGTSMATPHVSGSVALCIGNGSAAGPCSGLTPAQIIQKLRSDAQSHATAANGFKGDPNNQPVSGRHFGYLAWDGAY